MPPAYLKYAVPETPTRPEVLNVSDHAVVRWIERVMNINLDVSRRELTHAIRAAKNEGRWDRERMWGADTHLLWWLRSNGVDVEAHRRRILSMCKQERLWGTTRAYVDGHMVVIMNGTVVTVLS